MKSVAVFFVGHGVTGEARNVDREGRNVDREGCVLHRIQGGQETSAQLGAPVRCDGSERSHWENEETEEGEWALRCYEHMEATFATITRS